jgi:hypothetical protein
MMTWRWRARAVSAARQYDAVIVGAGPAGFAAAVVAARGGAKTLLLEMHPYAGGTWTAGCMTLIFDCTPQRGIMEEFRGRLEASGGSEPWRDRRTVVVNPEMVKLLIDEMLAEAGVDVRYHTMLQRARVDAGRIVEVVTASKSGRETWRGEIFVDATGDGDLGAFAGCGYEAGRPADGKMQPASMNAIIGGWQQVPGDGEALAEDVLATLDRLGFDLSYRKTRLFAIPGMPGLYRCMWTHLYGLDSSDAGSLTAAAIEGRRQVHAAVECLRASGDSRFQGLYVASTGPALAIREGRRIHGEYLLTIDDLRAGRTFEDGVVEVAFNVDIHHVDPAEGRHLELEPTPRYQVPYRCLVARDVNNMLMAGRCISGDFRAHASYRTTADCVAMGDVAGRAAAIASREGIAACEVDSAAVALLRKNGTPEGES